MKITEIDFYSRKKLTQNQELSMKVIFLPRKARKSSEFFNYSNYAPVYTTPAFKNKMFWNILILNKQSKYSFPELYSLFKSSEKDPFSDIFYKRAGIHKFLELLINIVMSLTNNLSGNSFFVNEHKTFIKPSALIIEKSCC